MNFNSSHHNLGRRSSTTFAVILQLASLPALAQTTSCVAPPPGLVCWWPANGDATDIVSGQNGTLNAGVTLSPGKRGLSFRFDGTSGYVKVPASSVINVGLGAGLTIEGWIAPSSVVDQMPIVEWHDPALGLGAHLWISVPPPYGPGSGCLYVALGFQKFFASAPGLIVANAFQHVAATYDVASGMCVLYLNGAIVAEQNFGSFTPNTIYDLYLGTRQIYGTWYWAGVLDEFSLYDRALSASEVAAIYTADNAGKCASAPPVLAIEPDGGGYLIRITATPGSTCRLQRAPTVRGPWSTSAPLTAPASGLVQFRDLFPPPGQGFYRVVQP